MKLTSLKHKLLKIWHATIDKVDSRRQKNPWYSSDYNILLKNSDEYIQMADIAFNNGIYSQVLHNGHIALELILKAIISREYQKHPRGHEIFKLVKERVQEVTILHEINSNPRAQIHFNKIYSAWDMHYRYTIVSVNKNEGAMYLNAFKEAYIWTKTKYCI